MAWTWVSREELASGDFPAVCALTGAAADARLPFTFDDVPDWAWLLWPFGVPFLLAAVFGAQKVHGQLPVVAAAVETHRRLHWLSTVLGALGLVGFLAGLAASTAWSWGWAAMALVGAGLTQLVATRRIPGGRLDRTGLWVKLRRVHPDFVAAVEAGGRVAS